MRYIYIGIVDVARFFSRRIMTNNNNTNKYGKIKISSIVFYTT